ncbi:MAG: hypothetical protein ACK4SY_01855 [Pyrobaculum sp.]
MDSEYLAQLSRCPSCSREMEVTSQFLRVEHSGRKILEKTLFCRPCNIKIRQYLQLT